MSLRAANLLVVLTLSTALVGCGGSMTLESAPLPTPLVQQIPKHVGLKIDPEMYSFSREEEILGRQTWSVDMGRENADLFIELFNHMFEEVTIIDDSVDPADLPIDALIDTSIDAFEFSIPEQTGTESFAIWIRYRLKVFNSDGVMVANWPVSAYGKSESRVLAATASLEKAAVLAMRDAAALMIMKLDDETGISSIGNKPDEATAAAPEAPSTATQLTAGGL